MKPSRILMSVDAITGNWHYALETARALEPYQTRLALACVGPAPTPHQRAEIVAARNVELYEHPFALEWMPNAWDDVARAGEWLLDIEDAFEPDVVHLNHYAYGTLPWNAPLLIAAHSDRISWGRAVGQPLSPLDEERYLSEMMASLRAAELVVAPSRPVLDTLASYHRSHPCGSDLFRRPPKVVPYARGRERYLSRPKREFILTAGRAWDAGKNMNTLEIAARDLPWPVFLAGSTEDANGCQTEFTAIDCLGPLAASDLANWMGLASIFVLPSRYEPTGLAALEAALCGCALVLADLPNLRETWCHAALFVNPNDPLDIANALQRLIRNDDLRNRLATQARKRALAHHPQRLAEDLLQCYGELLTPPGDSSQKPSLATSELAR